MRYKYEFEALDDFEPGRCAYCPLSWADGINYGDLFCVLNCNYEECPLEKVNESRKEAEKNDKTSFNFLADTLQGNINRMVVTDDADELLIMYMWSERILHTIHKERLKELQK